MAIHPAAHVDKSAVISPSAEIDADAYIGKNCIIGDNVKIGFRAIVECNTEIGEGTVLSPNAHVGGAPQDYSYKGEDTKLIIGKNCVIREFAPIHRATTKEEWKTVIGDKCYIMALSHIGHDCVFGNEITLVGSALIPGHVHVDDYAVISGYAGVHQGVRIGTMAMAAGQCHASMDVPPYCIIGNENNKGKIEGLNVVGMRRRGVKPETVRELKKALTIFLDKSMLLEEAKLKLAELTQYEEIKKFRNFLEGSKRGITRN